MCESTLSWIGNFEEKIDLSHIYLAVQIILIKGHGRHYLRLLRWQVLHDLSNDPCFLISQNYFSCKLCKWKKNSLISLIFISHWRGMYTRGCHTSATKIYWLIQILGYLRTLSLKFQKARTKIEVVLTLPCWLSQFSWAFWNFKLKVLKYPRNSRLHATLIPNLVKPLTYILSNLYN